MRSRAFPTGLNFSKMLQRTISEPSQSLSALAHVIRSDTNSPGLNAVCRNDHRDVPPINMALVYHNHAYSTGSVGGSSNVSPSLPINSTNQSSMFTVSPNSDPFLDSTGDGYPTSFHRIRLGSPVQDSYGSRSSSLLNPSPISLLPGGTPLASPSSRLPMDNLQSTYQSRYVRADQMSRDLTTHLRHTDDFHVHSLSGIPNSGNCSLGNLPRRNSFSAYPGTIPRSNIEGEVSPTTWLNMPVSEHATHPECQLQTHPRRRRSTQPTYTIGQHQSDDMARLFTTNSSSSLDSPLHPLSSQPALNHEIMSYGPSTDFLSESLPMAPSTDHWPALGDRTLPIGAYSSQQQPQQHQQHQNQTEDIGYYDASM